MRKVSGYPGSGHAGASAGYGHMCDHGALGHPGGAAEDIKLSQAGSMTQAIGA